MFKLAQRELVAFPLYRIAFTITLFIRSVSSLKTWRTIGPLGTFMVLQRTATGSLESRQKRPQDRYTIQNTETY